MTDSVLYAIAFTFDPSVGLLWFTLSSGASLVVARSSALVNPTYLRALTHAAQITFMHLVPQPIAIAT